MSARQIMENIYAVGAIDWDRTMFDALVPLPYGTSYNAYLIKGSDKTVLIDTVDPSKFHVLRDNLNDLGLDKIDYIVSNHAEQDHSGSIPDIMQLYPGAELVVNKKGQDILMPLMELNENRIKIVEDRETVSLGDRDLEFIFAPWVHWPETMFTYLKKDKILFSCDLFGSHLATSQLFASNSDKILLEAKRYYAEIMMPYASRIKKHLDTLSQFQIDLIAPSHGPVYDNPKMIIELYSEWISDQVKNEVIVLYVTMHGSTEKIAETLASALIRRNIPVKLLNLEVTDIGEVALSVVDAATVIFASPAVLMGPHPYIVSAAYVLNMLKPKAKYIGIIGSYGWGNKLVNQMTEFLRDLNVEFLDPLLINGYPKAEDLREIENFTEEILNRHQILLRN